MKQIELGGKRGIGIFVTVDDNDYLNVSRYKWCLSSRGYAMRTEDGKTIFMHRQIMNTPKGFSTDHVDGDKLNNQRFNLRVCSHAENMRNTPRSRGILTPSSLKILRFIESFTYEIVGAPTIREIAEALEIKSPGSMHHRIDMLIKDGWLDREQGRARGLHVVKAIPGTKPIVKPYSKGDRVVVDGKQWECVG